MRFLSLLAIPLLAVAQNADLVQKLDHVASGYNAERGFIGTVLVAKGGQIVFEKGYGMANIELDVPSTPDTKFRLGSITKQFTSTAILQLQEQGKLSVQDLACKYVDNCPESWKPVTIHQLLTHTSGIPSYTAMPEFPKPKFMRQPLSPIEVVMLTKDKPLDFPPGTKYRYDNTGYVMLGVIIEKVSGEKYADYLQKHILDPLEMKDTGYDVTRKILKGRAAGYSPMGPKNFQNADYLDMSLPHAAGSMYSTTRDLYRWDRALYGEKVLSKASKEAAWKAEKESYGYGWMLAPMANHKQIGHGGGINGFSTYIARFPEDDAAVIVLSNNEAGNAGAVAGSLAGVLFGNNAELPWERKAITLDPKLFDRYAGVYQVGELEITFTNENGHFMTQGKGQPKAEMFPSAENVFFLKVVDATLTFEGDQVTLRQGGATIVGKKK